MGNEHPFNPSVSLVGETEKPHTSDLAALLAFNHADYLFVPYTYQIQMQSNALKETQAQQGRQNRYYRRPPPVMLDTHSLISQTSSLTSNGELSPDLLQYRRNPPHYRPKGAFPNSPGRQYYHRSNASANQLFSVGMDMNGIPIPPPAGYSAYPSVPVYPPPLYTHAPFYPAQLHNSLGSSMSSSYGQTSPMSQSPMAPSYILHPHLPAGDYPPMPPHPGSPNTRNRSES